MTAGIEMGENGSDRAHPCRYGNGSDPSFEFGNNGFQRISRRIAAAGIIIACRFTRQSKAKVRCLVKGSSDTSILIVSMGRGLDSSCFDIHIVLDKKMKEWSGLQFALTAKSVPLYSS